MSSKAPFDAVIFDMDGVLVDGEPIYYEAASALLAEDGLTLPLDRYKQYMGTKAGWDELAEDLELPRPASYYRERGYVLVAAAYAAVDTALPGAVELVRGLQRLGLPLALASSTHSSNVAVCLDRLGIADAFTAVVCGDDVTNGKPDPEIYLEAAARLGLDPTRCLAIEDAPAGIRAARAAGMACWAVRTEYTRGLPLPDPDRTLDSLTEIDLADIAGVPA